MKRVLNFTRNPKLAHILVLQFTDHAWKWNHDGLNVGVPEQQRGTGSSLTGGNHAHGYEI